MSRHASDRPGRRTAARGAAPVLALALLLAWAVLPVSARAQTENLLDRITNARMVQFEERLTRELNAAISRYISDKQYVLRVNVIWNRDVIPAAPGPALSPDRQKLPGFPIFVRSPDAPAVDETVPPFVRMVVRVLMDETLPEYYELFLRKIVPVVARFDERRGDQVIVLKETFPPAARQELPPTLPEKELMQQLGGAPQPPPAAAPPLPGAAPAAPFAPEPPPRAAAAAPRMSEMQAAQIAFDEQRYTDALRIVQQGFQRAETNRSRGEFLAMEGSVYFTMKNLSAARESWKRALVFDPTNLDVHRALTLVETQPSKVAP
ncbi:MAG: hypothetical protein HY423_11580 [Candidatus Lambdaproteobacteria bacterium]|nr:hypothetical protein [Candidatus Lambdaproteobacteria bacterium]